MRAYTIALLPAALPAVAAAPTASAQGVGQRPFPTARRAPSFAGGAVRVGMTGAEVQRRLGRPSRVTLVPVLTSRHFYQVWRYPAVTVTLDEHDRVLSGLPLSR